MVKHLLTSTISGSLLFLTFPASPQELPSALADTSWSLVEFQSMDDAIGVQRPDDSSKYTMRLDADGSVTMQLNCNRASGSWTAESSGDSGRGSFGFGPLAMTRALCPPPSMDESIANQAEYIRSFVVEGGRLYLSLMADGGIYAWEPDPAVAVPERPEDGGPRVFAVTGIATALNMRLEPSTLAPVVGRVRTGDWLDNLGCRWAEDRAWCDVQMFGGGTRAWVAAEYLAPALAPDGSMALGPDDSALRVGQGEFDATGEIPCAMSSSQSMSDCRFTVARSGGGFATIVVNLPDGTERLIFFRMGVPTGAGTSEARPRGEFSATKEADMNLVRIGDERYEIPDAVVLGG